MAKAKSTGAGAPDQPKSRVEKTPPETIDTEEFGCVVRELYRCTWFLANLMDNFIEQGIDEDSFVGELAECGKQATGKQMEMLDRLGPIVGVDCSWKENTNTLNLLSRPDDRGRIADILAKRE